MAAAGLRAAGGLAGAAGAGARGAAARLLLRRARAGGGAPPPPPPPAARAAAGGARAGEAGPAGAGESAAAVRQATLEWDDRDRAGLKLRRRARMRWEGAPRRVLVVYKWKEPQVEAVAREVAAWLQGRGVQVCVERQAADSSPHWSSCEVFCKTKPCVDLAVALGGDGTLLHLASLFGGQHDRHAALPPCLSFAMGTLGFMTSFDISRYAATLERVLDPATDQYLTLRARLRCEVRPAQGGGGDSGGAVHHCLNEVVLDKGANPGLGSLDCFVDGSPITTVKSDGLIISTPSGSTGYNSAVGGPMVAPSVPCTILSPIAAASLSFRPIVIPEASTIRIDVPADAPYPGRAIFDGHSTHIIQAGGSLLVEPAVYPLPMINLRRYDRDWFHGLTDKLLWNKSQLPRASPVG